MEFKSGFVSIIGRPNVGKSTLLNKLSGEKIAIMSDKPQTTRNTIKSIVTRENYQIVFIDTPGIHKPKTKLGNYMVDVAKESLNEVDVILFLIEAQDLKPGPGDLYIAEQLKIIKTPVFLIINKIDLISKDELLGVIDQYKNIMDFKEIIPISAIKDDCADIIINQLKRKLVKGPKYFPDDMITDQPEKIIVAELVREKVLKFISEEIPHGVGVEIISFKNRKDKDIIDIQANIYCERPTHKGIIIGKNGDMLKRIGTLSRIDIEKLLGNKVFLELWVKVKTDWRNSDFMLKTLGYKK